MVDIREFSLQDTESYALSLLRAAERVSAGDLEAAKLALSPVAMAIWVGHLSSTSMAVTRSEETISRTTRESIRARVFMRDNHICTACGGRSVPRCVLVAMHDLFPAEIPYHPNYKRGFTHPVFWFLASEADHVVPHSLGGAFSVDNLTTLHAACNTQKSNRATSVAAVRGSAGWDGLLAHYPAMVAAGAGAKRVAYHRAWIRRFGLTQPLRD
ncbi:HNH endonuclease [Leucobacter insecticola]|uniref:HNH endonuclease n=1 Tax=Leucobacter insecticola TaxID=2714934 RepID=A0A6G8FGP1_9MICO|nr:HNH endonuclease [Leucobacter insecticola]